MINRNSFKNSALTLMLSSFVLLSANAVEATTSVTRTLVTEPSQGLTSIYDLINSAKKTIDMTMYELTDTTAENLLVQAASNGVTVRVILDQDNEKSNNQAAYTLLAAHGVQVHWANTAYTYTHKKTITVDGTTAAIMTLNLSSQYYSTSRDFAVIENDANDIKAIEAVFNADFANKAITPALGDDLVWSPTNSQSVLLALINGAKYNLKVENEEMDDTAIAAALASAAKRGVQVEVTMTANSDYATELNQLKTAGVKIATYAATAPLYIHAKVIIADFGYTAAKAYMGSENFSNTSLNKNRELGLTLTDSDILSSLNATLTSDFKGGTAY
ncbi:phospholipase D-like domain-containing protein [Solimicrobium silvestre]|uniref:phospholipase D n=1 Tax=Solimicrobium silvestre TaxID=2099400 RepID=A0A2S9GZ57_9BURK|nr:phospholipase D-like domain-containing protein [Solimicrobium silvestre]PRC92990.1 PLD-like domain [Solimicrobium silvestre]